MSEEKKDYTQILKRARRRRKRARYLHYAGIGTVLLLLVLCVFFVWKKGKKKDFSKNEPWKKVIEKHWKSSVFSQKSRSF